MTKYFSIISLFLFAFSSYQVEAQSLATSAGKMEIMPIVKGLKQPWGFAFLPGGGVLITERAGRLQHVDANGVKRQISGVPDVVANGQGGLLDVAISRNFSSDRLVFLSFSKKQGREAGTAVARARLSPDGRHLTNVQNIFEMVAGSSGIRHFGSRIVQAPDGSLYVTIGDRANRPAAQDLSRHEGSIIRISPNGGAASGNPFAGQSGIQPEIWSYGHRNPQGLALDLAGNLWSVEHGAKGGDEVNQIRKGANYGWPVISYGTHYNGRKIGEGTSKSGMQQPAYFWNPSIAPSGLMIYSGKLWPKWKGHMFVGSLKSNYISRLSGRTLRERERIRGASTKRVRDVREGPNGAIWFLSVDNGTLYRMRPQR